jgi:hypothetical protein
MRVCIYVCMRVCVFGFVGPVSVRSFVKRMDRRCLFAQCTVQYSFLDESYSSVVVCLCFLSLFFGRDAVVFLSAVWYNVE